jgi:hypothetical protein
MNEQTDNGNNGRDKQGRFIVGNSGGTGNPHAKQVALLRGALLSAVTPEDLHDVIRVLIEKALSGNVWVVTDEF